MYLLKWPVACTTVPSWYGANRPENKNLRPQGRIAAVLLGDRQSFINTDSGAQMTNIATPLARSVVSWPNYTSNRCSTSGMTALASPSPPQTMRYAMPLRAANHSSMYNIVGQYAIAPPMA